MKKGMVLLDTLYLTCKYPKNDIFNRWFVFANGVDKHALKNGIAVDNFVVRSGANGYQISLWQHDARIFLTDETDEKRGEGQGMGIQIQLGSKFIIEHMNELQSAVSRLLKEIGVRKYYPINVTRIDLAIDLFNVAMVDQDLEEWRNNWVGRAKVSKTVFNSQTGDLETIYLGSRKSAIYVRVYNKFVQAIKEGDIIYWWDTWNQKDLENVTRVEWEVKLKRGNFSDDLTDFAQLNGFALRELLNYLITWGRLCIPDETNKNRSRWQSAPIWKLIEEIVFDWSDGVTWPTSRYGKQFKGVSEAYIKQLAGNISGGMARLGGDANTIATMLEKMGEHGEGLERLQAKAKTKASIYKKL